MPSMLFRPMLAAVVFLLPCVAQAHGYAGKRYFPPTIEVDDPFAADEVHMVAGKRPARGDALSRRANVFSIGASVEVSEGLGFAIDTGYRAPNENLEPSRNGADNLVLSVKNELLIDETNELAVSIGLGVEIGGSGATGAKRANTFTPAFFYAKGFGSLPDSLWRWRPLAVTGVFGVEASTDSQQPTLLNWGFTVQYSLLYMQTHVRDLGLVAPFNRLVPVIEFPLKTCLNNACAGKTTGSFNPGVVWVGPHFNLALSLVKPINSTSGRGIGALLQFQRFFSTK
jgi:hypothetical protein